MSEVDEYAAAEAKYADRERCPECDCPKVLADEEDEMIGEWEHLCLAEFGGLHGHTFVCVGDI